MTEQQLPAGDELRERALKHLKKRRDFHAHLLIYVLVNGFFVVLWVLATPNVFFWPVFPIAIWGIGVVMNAWDVYFAEDFDEETIQEEMDRLERRR